MKCPCCSNEMEAGFLQGMQRVAWVKQPHKVSLHPKKGEVMLENNAIKGTLFPANICKACKQVVLDYSESDYQEG